MREHRFAFKDDVTAFWFVKKLCRWLRDLAIYRTGSIVYVIDGSDDGQGTAIMRLARVSGAWRFGL